ncbi:hypothetical protein PABG_11321 [Paracoccidioides brasiliensis Pb03]|nr:hypothetical protein PABG_11321 [Paracoccidioides brasiliensis Pb03]
MSVLMILCDCLKLLFWVLHQTLEYPGVSELDKPGVNRHLLVGFQKETQNPAADDYGEGEYRS